jgi:hypothetical protein
MNFRVQENLSSKVGSFTFSNEGRERGLKWEI